MKEILERLRTAILVIMVVIAVALGTVRLMTIQIVNGDSYLQKSEYTSVYEQTIKATRGQIVDVNGTPIVENKVGFNVIIDDTYFPSDNAEANKVLIQTVEILKEAGLKWNETIPITDTSPYDSGSYASSTTYLTGTAVVKACEELKGKIVQMAAELMQIEADHITFDGSKIVSVQDGKEMELKDFAHTCFAGGKGRNLIATGSHVSKTSPPPFMVGIAEVDVDKETGAVSVHDYVSVVDCGTIINSNLVRVQAEGGIAQGIGMALFEDIKYSDKGKMINNSFFQYKIPTRLDVGTIRVDFIPSYEDNGPFGAKSIGEVVINTPSPAIGCRECQTV